MTEMDLKRIREELNRLSVLIDAWNAGQAVPALERDLALGKLRELYDTICFADATAALPAVSAEQSELTADEPPSIDLDEVLSLGIVAQSEPAEPVAKPEVSQAEDVAEIIPESEAMPGQIATTEPVADERVIAEPLSVAQAPVAESAPAEKPVPVPEKHPEPVATTATLFELEDDAERHRRKQRVIMSLYGTPEPAAKPAPVENPERKSAPVPVPVQGSASDEDFEEFSVDTVLTTAAPADAIAPVDETFEPEPRSVSGPDPDADDDQPTAAPETDEIAAGAVLGEVINHRMQTLADTFAPRRDTLSEAVHHAPVKDLRAVIGINDRFLLIRDLFDGDAPACDAALDALNGFDNLDDCMIHIAENYVWNSNSDGAVFLMELLERKYA